jgi:hypothetical protein
MDRLGRMELASALARSDTFRGLPFHRILAVSAALRSSQDDVDAHLAGHFAGGLAAHPVAHHENAVAGVVAEVVLVVGAHAPEVGLPGYLDREAHGREKKKACARE